MPGGKKEFCSEPCLTAYRKAQKAINNSAPNPYSLPASTNGTPAARPSSTNSTPAPSDSGTPSGPAKNCAVAVQKSEPVTPTSSSSSSVNSSNNSAGEQGGQQEVKQEDQSPSNSKKYLQNPDQEVSPRILTRKSNKSLCGNHPLVMTVLPCIRIGNVADFGSLEPGSRFRFGLSESVPGLCARTQLEIDKYGTVPTWYRY
jgi:hypothetical protein